jgi:hypothetical protein
MHFTDAGSGNASNRGFDHRTLEQKSSPGLAPDKILRGTNPAGIPVEVSTKIEFAINVKIARATFLSLARYRKHRRRSSSVRCSGLVW